MDVKPLLWACLKQAATALGPPISSSLGLGDENIGKEETRRSHKKKKRKRKD